MKHLVTDRDRTSRSERAGRELPVLFHLMDVSRPRASTPAAGSLAPVADRLPAALMVETPATEPPAAELPPAPPPAPVSSVDPPSALPDPPTLSSPAPGEPMKFSLSRPIELCTTPSELAIEQPTNSNVSETTASNEPKAVAQHPVTPRPPIEARRKFRIPLSEDWFAAHGKYIAVVFVLALIGTVYLARTNRRPAASHAPADLQSAASEKSDQKTNPPAIAMPSTPPLVNNAPSSSPQLVDKASAVTETRAELFPPTSPSLAAKPAADEQKSSADNLFVIPQSMKPEERVAARPDSPQAIVNPTMTAPVAPTQGPTGVSSFAPPPAAAAPPPSAPVLAPAYPTTSTPMPTYPTTAPPQHAYPTTAAPPLTGATMPAMPTMPPRVAPGQPATYGPVYPTANTFQPPPAPPVSTTWQPPTAPALQPQMATAPGAWTPSTPGGWTPPPPTGGMPSQYQPPNNTASGFRNERTGSSLY